jgi:peptidoglycan/LPS O-acetylase OafA/YrhL
LGVFVHRFLLIPGTFSGNPMSEFMNSSLWSLRYEILCYALLPLLALAGAARWRRAVATLFVGAYVVWLLIEGPGKFPLVPRLVAFFAAGMFCYTFRDLIPYRKTLALAAAVLLVATFFTRGFRFALPIAGTYLLFFLAFSRRIRLQRFGKHGDLSYGLYVYAYPIQQTLMYMLGPEVPFVVFFGAAFGATSGVAYCSWHVIEKPALELKRSGVEGSG